MTKMHQTKFFERKVSDVVLPNGGLLIDTESCVGSMRAIKHLCGGQPCGDLDLLWAGSSSYTVHKYVSRSGPPCGQLKWRRVG